MFAFKIRHPVTSAYLCVLIAGDSDRNSFSIRPNAAPLSVSFSIFTSVSINTKLRNHIFYLFVSVWTNRVLSGQQVQESAWQQEKHQFKLRLIFHGQINFHYFAPWFPSLLFLLPPLPSSWPHPSMRGGGGERRIINQGKQWLFNPCYDVISSRAATCCSPLLCSQLHCTSLACMSLCAHAQRHTAPYLTLPEHLTYGY